MQEDYQVSGENPSALFTLKLHRGEGMTLIAMNWKEGTPPLNFVGFAIEYKEPKGNKFFALKNRLGFPGTEKSTDPNRLSTLRSPIQKFRWVHFPRNADLEGAFNYRVTPVFMNDLHELSYGDPQTADIQLARITYPGKLNVSFTRGFVSSQAFVDKYIKGGPINTLIPAKADDGLDFKPTHPQANAALAWMGFEAYRAIIDILDQALAEDAEVRVIAYDFNEPELIERLEKMGTRLRVIIDDSGAHGKTNSAESQAEKRIIASAGRENVKRQHMGSLQHNKTIVVDGLQIKAVVCSSTNLSWRGFFVQNNNAVILTGAEAVTIFSKAFDDFFKNDKVAGFGATESANWTDIRLENIDAKVIFSPHVESNAQLELIGGDISDQTISSLLYSLAFIYEVPGPVSDAIKKVSEDNEIFVYGISDKKDGNLILQKPDANISPVYSTALGTKNLPEPFKSEPSGGSGTRMHHKFIVIDFDKPTARVYLGSYNFSVPADTKNGENLLLVKDRRIATSYMIEALRIFDHYHFRVAVMEAKKSRNKLELAFPPRKAEEMPWWDDDYTDVRRSRDRELFS